MSDLSIGGYGGYGAGGELSLNCFARRGKAQVSDLNM